MVVCLRSTRFMFPDGSKSVFLDLRRLQDNDAIARGRFTRQFIVTKRLKVGNLNPIINKRFDTLPEARSYWREEAMKLVDKGMKQLDFQILGFHEED